jgi:hypothetical protein
MCRAMLSLFSFAALSAWVGAQSPATLPADVQVKQFKTNRILIENIVDNGIELSSADNPLQRAEACRRTALTLANNVRRAADNEDADRVAEFTILFSKVVREGVIFNLDVAKKSITPESQDAHRLKTVSDQARNDLNGIRNAIIERGNLSESEKVKNALKMIDEIGKIGF